LDNFLPKDLIRLFSRLISDDHIDIAQDPSFIRLSMISKRLRALVLADDFLYSSELSSPILTALVRLGLPAIAKDSAVQCSLADFVDMRLQSDPSFASVLAFLDFSLFSSKKITSLSRFIRLTPATIGVKNVETIIHSLIELSDHLKGTMTPEREAALMERIVGVRSIIESSKSEIQRESDSTVKYAEEVLQRAKAAEREVTKLRTEIVRMETLIADNGLISMENVRLSARHSNCRNIFAEYPNCCEVSSFPVYEEDEL
jgi:hypothetical protein